MTIGEHIRKLRRKEGLSQEQLAEIAQVTNKAVSSWEIGGRTPRLGALRLIANHFGICVNDLLTPEDSTSASSPPRETEHEASLPRAARPTNTHAAQPAQTGSLSAWDQELLSSAYINTDPSTRALVCRVLGIPPLKVHGRQDTSPVEIIVYDSPAAAGLPLYVDSSFERLIYAANAVPAGTDFGVRILGDSMMPSIPSGHIAFVRKQSTLRSGEIGIFTVDGEAICKRYQSVSPDRAMLVSDNPAYPPINATSSDVRVVGLVLGVAP